jgi:hypothetical protein
MQKVYSATSYFIIGYTIIIAAITSLYFLPGPLKASLGIVLAAIVFVDLGYRFFRKNYSAGETASFKSVVYLMTYWSFLSLSLDILLMVVILPLVASGNISWVFFNQQPSIYWLQFPMFYAFGFASQAIYNRVITITTAKIDGIL